MLNATAPRAVQASYCRAPTIALGASALGPNGEEAQVVHWGGARIHAELQIIRHANDRADTCLTHDGAAAIRVGPESFAFWSPFVANLAKGTA